MDITKKRASAKAEYRIARTVLKDKRSLLILGFMLLPVIIIPTVYSNEMPSVLGGREAFAPAFSTTRIFLASIGIGLCAGLITGCIGAGGGFVITPAFMSLGITGIVAVGTGLFHMFAKSMIGTVIHRKLGNVNAPLGIAFISGSVIGVTIGGTLNRAIYYTNPMLSDLFISLIYVKLLGCLGVYTLRDYLTLRKKSDRSDESSRTDITTKFARRLQSIHLPPMIFFDRSLYQEGRKISSWFIVTCGFIVGVFAAMIGVGGGFLIFPFFVYIFGVSSFTTVGTSIFQILVTAGFASIFQYAIYGFIFYTLALGLLLGSLIGVQIGALTIKCSMGVTIRGFYAIVIFAGFFNRLFALPKTLTSAGFVGLDSAFGDALNLIGIISFIISIVIFSGWVFKNFFTNFKVLKEI